MLKKIALVIAALVAIEGVSLAAPVTSPVLLDDATMVAAGLTFKPSNKVGIVYVGDTLQQAYTITGKHTAGDSYYCSSNISNNTYKKVVPADIGTAITAAAHNNSFAAGETVFSGYDQI